jgi:ComF family protein
MAMGLSNWRHGFLNQCLKYVQTVWPQHCVLCTAPARGKTVCTGCYESLPWLTTVRCPQCAMPTPDGNICGACLSHPPRYDAVSAAFAYAWPVAPLIHNYKYGANLALAQLLAHALAEHLDTNGIDLIIPMPLADERLRSRGFNQALEIARTVSRLTGIALSTSACRRVRDSVPQATLPWSERAKNIRRAFVCDADLSGMRVAVIDDVMTTGATLNELARNLRKAGAVEIRGWTVARTLPR